MVVHKKPNIHWRYYLAFEDELEKLAKYIEIDESNYCTYSIQLAHLLLAASSEVEVVLSELCAKLDPEAKVNNIVEYMQLVKESDSGMSASLVSCTEYGIQLSPWREWEEGESPHWWWAYNKIKHERSRYFQQANLFHVLNSVAALLVVNIYLEYEILKLEWNNYPCDLVNAIQRLVPRSSFFRIDDAIINMMLDMDR